MRSCNRSKSIWNQHNDESSSVALNRLDIAMQIAAMRPIAVSKDSVSQETIDHELAIGREQALAEGKPENIVDKIAQGKLNKFFQESTLLSQKFVKDGGMTVEQYLDTVQKGLTVKVMVRSVRVVCTYVQRRILQTAYFTSNFIN